MVRNMLFNLRQPGCRCERDDIIRSLEGVEAALVLEAAAQGARRGLAQSQRRVLVAMIALGGAGTPAQIGNKIDPSLDGYRAGAHVGSRLSHLQSAGLIRKAHYGWWEVTESGRAMAAAEGRPA